MKDQALAKMVLDTRYKKQKSKTFPVRLRVTHLRQQKYFPTKYEYTETVWKKMHGRMPDNLKDDLFELQDEEKRAAKIIGSMPSFSFDAFKKLYDSKAGSGKLSDKIDSYITELKSNDQIGNAIIYGCAKESFIKFRGEEVKLREVNLSFIKAYDKWMKDKGRSATTIAMYMRCIRAIINEAISIGEYQREYYPFGNGKKKYEIKKTDANKRALNFSEIEKIHFYEGTYNEERARDYWMFSYICNGMNMTDICLLKYSNINGEFLEFERKKVVNTNRKVKKIRVYLQEDARAIIKRQGNKNEPYAFIFPVLSGGESAEQQKKLIQQHIKVVNENMKKVADNLGLGKKVTTYYARHSMATVLKRTGASIEFIGELLGHSDLKTTQNYLENFEDEMIKEKMRFLTGFRKDRGKDQKKSIA